MDPREPARDDEGKGPSRDHRDIDYDYWRESYVGGDVCQDDGDED